MSETATRIVVAAVIVAALAVLLLASGWAGDHAKPGSTGRVPVTAPASPTSP